jgi:hypothetical protein
MAILLNDNLSIQAPLSADARYGPHADVATALSAVILANRFQGLTVGVISGGAIVEYWFRDGTANGNLILKVDNTANTSSANTIYLQGGLNSANANINLLFAYSLSANANASSLNTYSQSAYAFANSVNNYAYSAYAAANAAGSSALTQAAFNAANTAGANTVYLQGGLNSANANIIAVNTFAQSAYDKANTGPAGASPDVVLVANTNTNLSTGVNFILASNTITLTLPSAVGIIGTKYNIKNVGNGEITVVGQIGETIDNNNNMIITYKNSVMGLISDGSNWSIF